MKRLQKKVCTCGWVMTFFISPSWLIGNKQLFKVGLIPSVNHFHANRNNTNVPSFNCRTQYFKNPSFPNVITEWSKLDINIKSMTSYTAFKNALLSFIRPKHVDTFGIHNPIGLQLLTRLRLGFSHLNEHKFRHNFRDFLNPLCECNLEPKTASHFLLRCHLFQ